ncbi:Nucleolar protein 6 [Psilocybe cubensis]|uniref:U3 small nucleolar RNA-associated protein 22 n=2 Tax=Psilocybe cubensis TaxID=181762 RepID=A0A8H7XN74_PSICU|nr:Nucleolar protein 6 [Psilocybe cubensis]KAH9476209.1 Nucleolar protein 6 [Psilocybe cubensis]
MAKNLKRKVAGPSSQREKSPRIEEDDAMDQDQDSVMDDSEVEGSDEPSDAEMHGLDVGEEEEEWKGIGSTMDTLPDTHPTGKKSHKPPTGEELRAIRDASDLFKSGSFKLQVDALLPNVRPKASRVPPLERFLFQLHTFIKDIPSVSPAHPLEAARKLMKKGVAVPYSLPLPTEDTNWKVAYEPPTEITLVGSWGNKISVKAKDGQPFGVDLALEMPNTLFQEKDYLNGRYFHKRSFYLANIAAAIQKSKTLNVDVSYESLQGDPRLTKLVLTPKKDDSATDFTKLNAKICILPVLSQTSPIPLHRLSPSHSNIRVSAASETAHDDTTHPTHLPTPLYNTALLQTLLPKYQLIVVHALQNEVPAFSDALTLLRVWANQRGYSEGTKMCIQGFEGAGPWWWSLLALLLNGEEARPNAPKSSRRRSVGKGLSSYQLFKAALEFLAKHDFEKDSVFVKAAEGHKFPPEEYKEHTGAVFVDSLSLTNVLARVPLGSLELLRYDATKALEALNQTTFSGDPFNGVFLKDCRDLSTRFDVILRVDLTSAKPRNTSVHSTLDIGSPANALLSSISTIVRQGLGDRSRAVALLHPSSLSRSVSQAHPSSPDTIFIGIIHNPEHAFRLVDHGPAADANDQTALETFRAFWGSKSELRRFKDGRIAESVVWDVKTADEKAHVPAMIVRHLLGWHFGLGEKEVGTWDMAYDALIRLPPVVAGEIVAAKVQTGVKGAMMAFDALVKEIKKLDDELPLALLNVSPIAEALRYTSVFSPVAMPPSLAQRLPPTARYAPPIEVVLEFEKSARWPDDVRAVQVVKMAFMERLGSALMESVQGMQARVITGHPTDSELVDRAVLELITPEGWAFHARIWYDREVNLLDNIIGGRAALQPHIKTKDKEKERKGPDYHAALKAKEVYTRLFVHAPRHHRAIAALAHRYGAFAGTVRLAKRWLAAHWVLGAHVGEEVVEVICASLFVGAGAGSGGVGVGGVGTGVGEGVEQTVRHLVPGSKERGFALFVQFLKEWKWEEGLFVPLYGGSNVPAATTTAAAAATSKASTASVAGPNKSVWKVSTEHDPSGHVWTYKGPDLVVAHRVRALASATYAYLGTLESGQLDIRGMFIHPTDDYDFVLCLDPGVIPRYVHNVGVDVEVLLGRGGKYANRTREEEEESVRVMPGFDPARMYFDDLQRIYMDTCKLFYDPLGGTQIGGVWDPTVREPRAFRVLGGFSCAPVKRASTEDASKSKSKEKDKNLVVLNQDSVLAEMERMGTGMVKKIVVVK